MSNERPQYDERLNRVRCIHNAATDAADYRTVRNPCVGALRRPVYDVTTNVVHCEAAALGVALATAEQGEVVATRQLGTANQRRIGDTVTAFYVQPVPARGLQPPKFGGGVQQREVILMVLGLASANDGAT